MSNELSDEVKAAWDDFYKEIQHLLDKQIAEAKEEKHSEDSGADRTRELFKQMALSGASPRERFSIDAIEKIEGMRMEGFVITGVFMQRVRNLRGDSIVSGLSMNNGFFRGFTVSETSKMISSGFFSSPDASVLVAQLREDVHKLRSAMLGVETAAQDVSDGVDAIADEFLKK